MNQATVLLDQTSGPIGVMLVEDHAATRAGLRAAIDSQAELRVVGEAATWHEAFALARRLPPDVLVLDLHLPDGNGLALLEQLRALRALPPTLILSICDERIYARRVFQAGARGYLMKEVPLSRILQAIREIHAGGLVASSALASEPPLP